MGVRTWGCALVWGVLATGCIVAVTPGEDDSTTGETSDTTPTTVATTMTTAPDGTAGDDANTDDPTGNGTGCCEAHLTPGCDEPPVEECVCELSAFCCQFEWDAACASLAVDDCGGCGQSDTAPDDTGGGADCCVPTKTPGCADTDIETCVCGLDPFCCDQSWDQQCIDESVSACGADCDVPPPPPDDCCGPGEGGGCDIEAVESCVCDIDASCCDTQWDAQCVALGFTMCKNDCPGLEGSGGDCCAEHDGTGCDDPFVTACACALDDFCCAMTWDGLCVQGAALLCASGCPVDFGPCCEPNDSPGCNDLDVVDCICALDPFCCNNEWDQKCVDGAEASCALDCTGVGTGGSSGSGGSDTAGSSSSTGT